MCDIYTTLGVENNTYHYVLHFECNRAERPKSRTENSGSLTIFSVLAPQLNSTPGTLLLDK